ncbi:hypothetical protein NIES37_70360 (plasmid) [Tolypothrix tenuis PCC 7101]|uniref:DUF5895 domain-containing protein n=1 Tax=Tolypothrix tenuis PCC 7101 TaxID=231146 RepID=A0A1Z4NBC6_9CYAN|nr:hypothetical protein [Aulosira sp. FACHB-113]BAZ03023.1 hypothetical protein NIES37_70360 [Tolypothrix tenuis PCC 7101]BAZ78053.1 hypothetical protein NIES50_66860 [Aulosira laxa NIES-50]
MVKSKVTNDSNRPHQSTAKTAADKPKGGQARTTDTDDYDFEGSEFEIDPELFNDNYNQVRKPILPYGIVVNDKPAGLLIPEDQLEKAGWIELPKEDDLTTVTLTEDVTGLLITECRLLVLAFAPEYIRYKSDVEEVGGSFVGFYEDYRHSLDKKTMDVCSEHALMFLDDRNQPLHTIPVVVRFKNVALWSFKSVREEFYRSLEKTFADYFQVPFSGKSDKWRSLGVLEVEFKAIKEGEGKNKHNCCKTVAYTKPTVENLPQLYLGKPTAKTLIWQQHDAIAGFNEPQSLPALPGESVSRDVEVLPPNKNKNKTQSVRKSKPATKPPRKIQLIDYDDFLDETDDLEADLDDDFENNEELDDEE